MCFFTRHSLTSELPRVPIRQHVGSRLMNGVRERGGGGAGGGEEGMQIANGGVSLARTVFRKQQKILYVE